MRVFAGVLGGEGGREGGRLRTQRWWWWFFWGEVDARCIFLVR